MTHLNLIKKHVLRIEAIKKITSGLLLLSFIMIFMGGTAAAQTTFTVSNTDDSGTGSFRWAIEQANSEAGSSIISFNIPGSGPHTILISTPLNPIQEQVTITMMNQDGYEDIPVVMLDGSVLSDGNGLEIQAENVSIEGLSIINFPGNGIYLNGASGSELTRNFLGVETDGVTAAGNGESGILILNGNDVILLQNIVSGNAVHGIYIDASVDLDIFESDVKRTQILENRIGTDYDGLTAIGNGGNGIRIDDSPDNLISGNLVSGNGVSSTNRSGILLNFSLTTANVIEENRIGTTQSGNSPLGNLGNGIALNFAPGNQIQNNIIGSNNTAGITLFQQADDNQIFGNSIGIGEDGATALPNQVNGISIVGSKDNEVGSSLSEHSNTIAYNLANGITILNSDELESINNKIIGNSIFSNAELGINLAQSETDNTVSENDVLDDDEGPNRLQNFPDLASATYIDGDTSLDITYSLSSDPTHSSYPVQIEFFKTNTGERQGKEQLGTDSYSEADYSFGEKTVNLPIPADVTFEIGDRIVATATDNQGNTSEFSDAIFEEVILGPEDFIVVNTNDSGEGSLRWVIENVNLSTEVRTVTFNIPGDPPYTITPQSPLPIVEKPVTINGASQPGYIDGSLNPSPIIELSGINAGTANGIEIRGGNTQIQALTINHFSDAGISISEKGGNEIIFNFIGTNITGDTAASNGSAGIFIDDVPDNVVFGNLISGNNTGIFVQQPGATGNVLEGNTIGLDVTGSVAIPNEVDGVRLANGPSGNGVVDNFISGNGGKGIYVLDILGLGTSNNTLRGNIIGTDALVTARVPNQSDGIRIEQSDNNQIYSNVLSGNNSNGIEISGVQSTGNQISGNIIGLGEDGETKLANLGSGVALIGAVDNTIGGTESWSGNLISGNGGIFDSFLYRSSGLLLTGGASGNRILGNFIGTDLNGDPLSDTGNFGDGIKIEEGSSNNTIGLDEAESGVGNIIAGNGEVDESGVAILGENSLNNRISGNSIFENFTTGIDLGSDGNTDNDADDSVTGPNNLLNFPVLSSAVYDDAATELTATFSVPSVPANSDYPLRIEFYKNNGNRQGEFYLGSAQYEAADFGSDKEVVITVSEGDLIAVGDEITALSISATGNTSEFSGTVLVESTLTSPDIPVLFSPSDNATEVSVAPLFTWQTIEGAETYELQVSTVSDFSSTVLSESGITATEFQAPQLSYTTGYFWRVRAVNEAGQSDWSTVWSFTTEAEPQSPPEVVVLSSPADGAVDVPISPTLNWEASAEAASYIVQVSRSSDFASPVVDQNGVTATELDVADLDYETFYYWRVRAVNGAGQSDWSSVRSFTTEVEPLSPPEVVVLSSPSDNASEVSIAPLITWQTSAGAETYELQVSTVSDFSSTVVNDTGITGTEFQAPQLSYETNYFWRVRASNAAGQSDWSTVWSFTIEVEPLNPPGIVILTSPSNGATDISTGVTFSWQEESLADSYQVQVSEDQQFATSQVDEQGITGTSYDVNGLSPSTSYYWRVRAQNEDGTGDWSSTWAFATADLTPPISVTVSVQNGSPRVTWDAGSGGSSSNVNVYRGMSASALELVETVAGGESEYLDSSAPSGPLFYAVTAVTSEGQESDFSEVVSYYSEAINATAEWQLVSHPVNSVSLNASGALVYGFNRVYQSDTNLESGSGYWIKSDTPLELTVAGQGATTLNLELNEGWNLIGAPSGSAQISALEDPGSILPGSPVYRFNNGNYESVSEIVAGSGYWIFADQPGTITANVDLTPQAAGKTTDFIAGRVENAPVNRLIVSQNGYWEEIIIMESPLTQKQEYRYMKPPQVPEPNLDVRTVNHLFAADESITELKVVSNSWPVMLNFQSDFETNQALRIHLKDESGAHITRELAGGGELSLKEPYSYIAVELISSEEMVTETTLEPGYPNPFNPSTNIRYRLSQQADVTVEVYDTGGRRVALLVNQSQQAGTYTVPFNASNLASGIYFVRMQTGAFTNIQKLTLIK